jgi:hypothetical protein
MYLFIYGLYKHGELDWRPVVSNDWNAVNNELERMGKGTTLAYFKVLPRLCPEELNKTAKTLR